MKKLSILFILSVLGISVFGQSVLDVMKYTDRDILGTARYMSMAGSMGALGGDPTAIYDNPAGLGIYRSSELSFTLNATPSVTKSYSSDISKTDNKFFFNFNQFSFVLSIPSGKDKGYVSSNFSFSYNRLKDFHRKVNIGGNARNTSLAGYMADFTQGFYPSAISSDNEYVPFLSVLGYEGYVIDPNGADSANYLPYDYNVSQSAYYAEEKGRIEEYNISYAANIGHYLYLGVGMGIQNLSYKLISDNGEIYTNGANMILHNVFTTSGVGYDIRLGIIARPVSFLRLGFSFQSPIWYSMKDNMKGSISASGTSLLGDVSYSTPQGYSTYKLNMPLKLQASVALILGKSGLINFDYVYSDSRTAKLKDENSGNILFADPAFTYENSEIKQFGLKNHLFKIGAEYRIMSKFAIRAGFAYQTPDLKSNTPRNLMNNTIRTDAESFVDVKSLYGSVGLGYRYNGFGIDLTYAYSETDQLFNLFQDGAVLMSNGYFGTDVNNTSFAKLKTIRHNAVLTLSYKF